MPRSISEGGLSQEELRAITRRLPAHARAVLRHMNSAASDADAADEARWQQHNLDIKKRGELVKDIKSAEAAYENAAMYGKPKKVLEARARTVAEAREELAIFNRHADERAERAKARRAKNEESLLSKIHGVLAQYRHATFVERPVELPSGEPKAALAKVRSTIDEKTQAISNADLAPVTYDEAMAKVDAELDRVATEGEPDTFSVTRYATVFGKNRSQGTIRWRTDYVASEFFPSGFKLTVWALKDVIRAKLEADIKARIERSEIEPLSITARKQVKARLAAEILDLEYVECRLIAALQADGDESVSRRYDTNPLAVLGIEVIPAAEKPQGVGSAAAATVFPVEGQKMPVSRGWVRDGARYADGDEAES